MKVNKKIKVALKRILSLLVLAGFIFLLVAASKKQSARQYHEGLIVSINYDDGNYFIAEDEIKGRVNAWLGRPVSGFAINELNITELEQILMENPYLRQSEVFIDANSRLHILVDQRKPILRVINKDGVSYYIHESGGKMPVSNKFTPRVPVATGHILDNGKYVGSIEDEQLMTLAKLAAFIHNDRFMQALVDQVVVHEDGQFELIPKIDNHSIMWGSAQDLEQKKQKLQLFYKDGIKKAGWKSYQQVDLRFKDQIVCKKR